MITQAIRVQGLRFRVDLMMLDACVIKVSMSVSMISVSG